MSEEATAELDQVPVERDSCFIRCVADEGVPIALGRDIEFAFLQFSPKIHGKSTRVVDEETEEEGFALSPTLTEVARVRMGPHQAMAFALATVDSLLKTGRVNIEALEKSIAELVADARSVEAQEE